MATMTETPRAVILAATEGSGLRPFTRTLPQVLLPVAGVPLMKHSLTWLNGHGIRLVAINRPHQRERIVDYLREGSPPGMVIDCPPEGRLPVTADAVKRMEDSFHGTLVVVNGDVLTDLNLSDMVKFHWERRATATIAVAPVSDPEKCRIVAVDGDEKLLHEVEKPTAGEGRGNLASIGVYVLEESVLGLIPGDPFSDFGFHVLPAITASGGPVYAFRLAPQDYWANIGGLERYYQVHRDALAGRIRGFPPNEQRNIAVFLDRDGTMAPDVPYCHRPEDLNLFPGVAEAVRRLNQAGFKVIVVTNQSGIARGYFTHETLADIHAKMERDLALAGARLDGIYYCPHHPDEGCDCRKPKPVMLFQAALDHGIDLANSYLVGDSSIDIQAGRAAGCRTVLVTQESHVSTCADATAESIMDATRWITTTKMLASTHRATSTRSSPG